MTKNELKANIRHAIDCHSDTSREYEINLTSLVNACFDVKIAEELLNDLKDSVELDLSYALFCCINIYHRNLFNNDLLLKVWENYSELFDGYPKFDSS